MTMNVGFLAEAVRQGALDTIVVVASVAAMAFVTFVSIDWRRF